MLTIVMDDTQPKVPSDLTPCTPLGVVLPTSSGLSGSTQISWFQDTNVNWCWTSPVRRAALGTAPY